MPGLWVRASILYSLNVLDLWLMPLECLHMTALEVAHSMVESQIEELLGILKSKVSNITNYTLNHRASLFKPLLSYDNQAIALSFLPTSNESIFGASAGDKVSYTYHHLRRDLYDLCESAGVTVGSRYVVPSAHLTIARYVTEGKTDADENTQTSSSETMVKWVDHLEEINNWLKEEFWPESRQAHKTRGDWVVGEERGLDCRAGTLWYGGGRSVDVGKGFTITRPKPWQMIALSGDLRAHNSCRNRRMFPPSFFCLYIMIIDNVKTLFKCQRATVEECRMWKTPSILNISQT